MLKLPSHNRYDYSCVEKRRDYSWPDGKRLAFYVALNVEDFAFMAGRGNDPYLRTNSPQTQRN
jgi:allantoinase